MKTTRILLAASVAALLIPASLSGRPARLPAAGDSLITVSGTLSGISAAALAQNPSVSLYSGRALDPAKPLPGTCKTYPLEIANNHFHLKVPRMAEITWLQVNVLHRRNFLTLGHMLVLGGDSLHIAFSADQSFIVTGSGAQRVNKQIALYDRIGKLRNYHAASAGGLSAMIAGAGTLLKDRAFTGGAPAGRAGQEGPEISRLMEVGFRAAVNLFLANALKAARYSIEPRASALALKYLDSVRNNTPPVNDPFILNHSLLYVKSMLRLNEAIGILRGRPQESFFGDLYTGIQQNYSGLLKDRMVLFAFWQLFGQYSQAGDFMDEALQAVQDDWTREQLQSVWLAKRKGQKAFDFTLEDSSGKTYRLEDFKNKFLVCHFWFNGCSACPLLVSNTADIVKKYSRDTSVIFISINVDRSRARWLAALEQGIYTHTQELNLYTGGLGIDHPFVKYYHFVSFPRLILIDREGKVVSTNPPRPYDRQTARLFGRMLDEAVY